MLTALDADPNLLDEQETKFVAQIREHGWFGTHVLAESALPGFSYSTGFCISVAAPEVITFGFKQSSNAQQALWNVFKDLKRGRTLPPGLRVDNILESLDVVFLPVAKCHYREHLGWSLWFYSGDSFPCLQMVGPDRANRFPWEDGFDTQFAETQPDLTGGNWAGRVG